MYDSMLDPSEWKMHRITPIFKAGDRMSVKNYRPISLLCNVSKVLERLIFDKVSPFVTRQITMSQFGFLRNHSSVQQILKFLNNIVNQIDKELLHKLSFFSLCMTQCSILPNGKCTESHLFLKPAIECL